MWRGKRKKSPNQHGTRSLRDIFPVRTINADTTVVAQTLKLKSEDDGNGMRKKTATRSVSAVSTAFAAANASITEESSEDGDDDDLLNYTLHISSTATRSKSDEPKETTSVISGSAKSDKAEEITSVISGSTFAAAKMKFTIPFPNDKNATKGAYFSSSSSPTPSATKTALKKRPSRVAKKTVLYYMVTSSRRRLKLTLPTATAMRRRLSDPP
jgi:hypothetical protein